MRFHDTADSCWDLADSSPFVCSVSSPDKIAACQSSAVHDVSALGTESSAVCMRSTATLQQAGTMQKWWLCTSITVLHRMKCPLSVCRPAQGSRQHCARKIRTLPGQLQGREGPQHRIVLGQLQAMSGCSSCQGRLPLLISFITTWHKS